MVPPIYEQKIDIWLRFDLRLIFIIDVREGAWDWEDGEGEI